MLVVWARPEPVGVDEGSETERQTAEEVPRDALLLEVRQMREKSLKLRGDSGLIAGVPLERGNGWQTKKHEAGCRFTHAKTAEARL
jgi:hypothetical protein